MLVCDQPKSEPINMPADALKLEYLKRENMLVSNRGFMLELVDGTKAKSQEIPPSQVTRVREIGSVPT